ncbi:MAG: hypothetical protein F9K43_11790, partial [Bauldia sp.]
MTRALKAGERLVVASHNPGKLAELEAMVAPFGLSVVSAASLGLPERAPADVGRAMIAAWIDAPGYEAANAEMRRYVCEDL